MSASARELMACTLARELHNGERLAAGSNSPVARAAVLLAHLTRGPNMRIFASLAFSNFYGLDEVPAATIAMDDRMTVRAEAFRRHDEGLEAIRLLVDAFFVGALQVDRYGNSNLIGLKGPDGALSWRGPGPHATTSMADHVRRYFIVLERHDPEVFVERCDYVSCVGFGRPEVGRGRADLGLPGGGPALCVTPLACLDFQGQDHSMRLRSVHPGVTVEEVEASTGFRLERPAQVPKTVAPAVSELNVLRRIVDPDGVLRRPLR